MNEKISVLKTANIKSLEATEEELKKINLHTIETLNKEDVFTFKVRLGTNLVKDDRNFEPFNARSLKDLVGLYPGMTMIKDHERKSDNQIARIYDTEYIEDGKKTNEEGAPYAEAFAKCYMVLTETNEDLIKEIKAGIKKEVSTSCRPKKAVCSICGVDNIKTYCSHFWGIDYETESGKKTCYFTLDGVKEAYELSFVATPAQKKAGATKNYNKMADEQEKPDKEIPKTEEIKIEEEKLNEEESSAKARIMDSFLFAEEERNNE